MKIIEQGPDRLILALDGSQQRQFVTLSGQVGAVCLSLAGLLGWGGWLNLSLRGGFWLGAGLLGAIGLGTGLIAAQAVQDRYDFDRSAGLLRIQGHRWRLPTETRLPLSEITAVAIVPVSLKPQPTDDQPQPVALYDLELGCKSGKSLKLPYRTTDRLLLEETAAAVRSILA